MNLDRSDLGDTSASWDSRWGDTFLNRFDGKVRGAGRVIHPFSGKEFRVNHRVLVQCFRRMFGQVVQFLLTAGWFKRRRMCLAVISLGEGGLQIATERARPAEDLYRQISSPAGLDFRDDTFYGVGIFSPVGWPDTWKCSAEVRGNVHFYLVEKPKGTEGTRWDVFGPEGPLRDLFDPETPDEKKARAEKALANHSALLLPGDQLPMDLFLEEFRLDRKTLEEAIRSSGGRLQVIHHKGRSAIQRIGA